MGDSAENESEIFNKFANTDKDRRQSEKPSEANVFEIPRVITTSDLQSRPANNSKPIQKPSKVSALLIDDVAHLIIEDELLEMCWGI